MGLRTCSKLRIKTPSTVNFEYFVDFKRFKGLPFPNISQTGLSSPPTFIFKYGHSHLQWFPCYCLLFRNSLESMKSVESVFQSVTSTFPWWQCWGFLTRDITYHVLISLFESSGGDFRISKFTWRHGRSPKQKISGLYKAVSIHDN